MTRLPWWHKPTTPAEIRAAGDDYLLPYDWDKVSAAGLCIVLNNLPGRFLATFRPSRKSCEDFWWGYPEDPHGREPRAWACYFIAAMMEDDTP